jgi:chemotaxis protein methyltransferase CheR
VLNAIAAQMAPDGVLYLGGAETIFGITDHLATIEGERGVYTPAAVQPARVA